MAWYTVRYYDDFESDRPCRTIRFSADTDDEAKEIAWNRQRDHEVRQEIEEDD